MKSSKIIEKIIYTPILALFIMVVTIICFYFISKTIKIDVYQQSVAYYDVENKYIFTTLMSSYDNGFINTEEGKHIKCKKIGSIENYDVYLMESDFKLDGNVYINLQVKVDEITFYQQLLGGKY